MATATAASGLGAGLNLYSFFKGVDDSNDEYRKQQDEERKKLEEFRAQERLLMQQKDQEYQDTVRANSLIEYGRNAPVREKAFLTAEEALQEFQSEGAKTSRQFGRTAKTDKETIESQVQIGLNRFNADNLPKILGQQVSQGEVALSDRDAQIEQGKLAVETKNAITQALKSAPAYGDSKLRDLDASEFARLSTLKERQDFLTRKGYGITANEDGSYKLGSGPLSFTEADVNLLITKPATAVKDVLASRIAATKEAGNFGIRQQTVDNATRLAGATVLQKVASASKSNADAEAIIKANSPTTATTKASLPPSPPSLQPSRPPLIGAVQSGGGTPAKSFSSAATTDPAATPQGVRDPNEVGSNGVSNEINRMSLSELDVFKKALESAVLPSQPDENRIIFDKIREVNRVYGEKKGAENKLSRDSESKSEEELAAKALADKKAAEKLTQDAAKARAEDLIANALAKAKNK